MSTRRAPVAIQSDRARSLAAVQVGLGPRDPGRRGRVGRPACRGRHPRDVRACVRHREHEVQGGLREPGCRQVGAQAQHPGGVQAAGPGLLDQRVTAALRRSRVRGRTQPRDQVAQVTRGDAAGRGDVGHPSAVGRSHGSVVEPARRAAGQDGFEAEPCRPAVRRACQQTGLTRGALPPHPESGHDRTQGRDARDPATERRRDPFEALVVRGLHRPVRGDRHGVPPGPGTCRRPAREGRGQGELQPVNGFHQAPLSGSTPSRLRGPGPGCQRTARWPRGRHRSAGP